MPTGLPQNNLDWARFLSAMVLVGVRLSGVMVFAPVFSSEAIPARVKAIFVLATAILLAPLVSALPSAHADLGVLSVAGELSIGLILGLSLSMLSEILLFAGQIFGFQFSFSLVNLLDPNSTVQTPLMGQLLTLLGTLVLVTAGLDRTILLAMVRSFRVAPVGGVFFEGDAGLSLVRLMSGVFLAALQLAAPVLAATLLAEVTIAVLGKISPQLPVMIVAVPAKTLVGYTALIGSLALWPRFIEARFAYFLDTAEQLIRHAAVTR
ncbi:MAG TPA: flagellar biosynthetic protein FliR [Silvibacterium sp.]|nr:flagellar biosynthetic protein FliR [Silvibacterium sp.]